PPFEATAPTVLGQVFRLLETRYQGDGLCCLLDFLIPAKRLFEHVRQAACAPYFNCVFLHEGWPLCLREKVVVHLAPLNPLLLRSGDFYLQAEPGEERAARLTLKHLSGDLRAVRRTPVPEAAYALLFTHEWLEEINRQRGGGAPLRTCLVATEDGIAPLPWSSIATPEFVDKPDTGPGRAPAPAPSAAGASCAAEPAPPGPYSNVAGSIPGCKDASRKPDQGKYPGLIKVDQLGPQSKAAALAVPSLREIVSRNLEGEYVDLLEPSEEKLGLPAPALPPAHRAGGSRAPCAPCLGTSRTSPPTPFLRNGALQLVAAKYQTFSRFLFPRTVPKPSFFQGKHPQQPALAFPGTREPGEPPQAALALLGGAGRGLETGGRDARAGRSCSVLRRVGREPPRAGPGPRPVTVTRHLPSSAGSTDKLGRALLQVSTSGSAWTAAWCSAGELARLVLYLCSIPRNDVPDGGLTVVVDARQQPPSPVLFAALRSVQVLAPGSIHAVLLLAEKELPAQREKLPGVQVETLPSLKALGRYVDSSQLTRELDGTFPYCHSEWVQFFQVPSATAFPPSQIPLAALGRAGGSRVEAAFQGEGPCNAAPRLAAGTGRHSSTGAPSRRR
uniref:KIAA1755 n=1 Tax=Apteryx owenii TaxID=8824 RepID=A0A8B9P7R7_APTOW